MLEALPEIQSTVRGLGVIVGTQRPFCSFLLKNWPLTLLAAWGMYARGKHRWDQGEFTSYNLLADAGLILSPLIGLAILNQIAQQDQLLQQATQPQPAPGSGVTAANLLQAIQSPVVGPPMASS